MADRKKYDPQLHLLRSTARYFGNVNPRSQHDIESARFSLYSALEAEDYARARMWLRALETAIQAAASGAVGNDPTRKQITEDALDALDEIREGMEAK